MVIDNIEILKQGIMMIILMLFSFLPEAFCLFRNVQGKGVVCFLGILSKIVVIYFFSMLMVANA